MLLPKLNTPTPSRFLALLRSCAGTGAVLHGRHLHAHLTKSGLRCSPPFPTVLLHMYGKCGVVDDALRLFDEIPRRDAFLWSALLAAHVRSGFPQKALRLLPSMMWDGVAPDGHIFSTLAKACADLAAVKLGKQVQGQLFTSGFYDDDVIKSTLVDMYSKCGFPDDARKVFNAVSNKNIICWTAMVSGYASNGFCSDALSIFRMMPQKELLAWTALVSGFVQSGENIAAVKLFAEMRQEEVDMEDSFLLSTVVGASANLASLELGRQLHCLATRLGHASNLYLQNSLVDMYAKCCDIMSSRAVFDVIKWHDIVSWTTMIVGEAQHGQAEKALLIYKEMYSVGVRPNQVTFLGLLYACSHAGLVHQGKKLFNSMVHDYGLKPSLQHYTCMVDLFSRSELLSEAEEFIKTMPIEPDEAMWAALLSSCKRAGDSQRSSRIADYLLKLQPKDPSTYVLLANTYAAAGQWDTVSYIRKLMMHMDIRKEAGYSRVEAGRESYIFRAGEVPLHMKDEMLGLLDDLLSEMTKRGYTPDVSSVMHDLEYQEKLGQLFLHSERLAVVYGLLKTVPGTAIRIVKNLRVCPDCHTVLKFVSSITCREIVVRDANRFHHYKDGVCSCGDFW